MLCTCVILIYCDYVIACLDLDFSIEVQAVNAVALVRSGASQSLLDLDGVLRVMKDPGVLIGAWCRKKRRVAWLPHAMSSCFS